MISTKNLVKLRKIAVASTKRISLSRTNKVSSAAEKGQFVVYTADERRSVLPLVYLQSHVVRELLRMSEDEFGLGGYGPIVFPCDSVFMEYVISMIQQTLATETEEAIILSLSELHLKFTFMQCPPTNKLLLVHGDQSSPISFLDWQACSYCS